MRHPSKPPAVRATAGARHDAARAPRPGGARRLALAAITPALLVTSLSACLFASPPLVSDLRTVEGPLVGYPDGLVRPFVGVDGDFAFADGFAIPGANARVEGVLVALEDLPAGALGLPEGPACPELVLDPPDLRIHWQRDLWLFEGDTVVGFLARTTTTDFFPQVTGDRLYGYVAASTAGSVTGTCDTGGQVITWDLQLLEGWNHALYRVDADAPVRRTSLRVEAPEDDLPFRYFLPN